MYSQKHQGHGICGSRNIYSSRVRVDNWVEDTISLDLLKQDRNHKADYTTITKIKHCHPKEMPEPPPVPAKMPSTHELKTKNKDGLAYELLFEHGTTTHKQSPDDRFKTVTNLTIMTRPDLPPSSPTRKLLKNKSKQMLVDLNQSYHMSTEYRQSTAHLKYHASDSQPTQALLKTAEIPKFHRRALISST